MANEIQGMHQTPQLGEIVLYQPDETVRLEVRLEDDTVWLTQAQISQLFQRERSVISRHINNTFNEGECDQECNVHFLHIPNSDKLLDVRNEGISATICTERIDARLQHLQAQHNSEHSSAPVSVQAFSRPFHDRFLVVDEDLWHCGDSFKDLGRKLFAIDKMGIDKTVILNQL